MATEMKQRRDTAASWATKNEVLGDGVIGVVRETHQFKIGDGVTPWNSLPFSVISPQMFDAVGDLLVGTGSDSFTKLPTGTPGQRLTVAEDGTLEWVTPPNDIPLAVFANEGDIVYGTGVGTLTTLPVGTVGQRLTVQADHSLAWATPEADIPLAIVDAAGDLIVGSADNTVVRLAKGSNGQVLTVNGSGQLQWITPSADIPLSTIVASGDLVVGSGAGAVAKLAKGANGQVLTVVAGVLAWATPSADVPLSTITAAGDLLVGSAAGTVTRIGSGFASTYLAGVGANTIPQWKYANWPATAGGNTSGATGKKILQGQVTMALSSGKLSGMTVNYPEAFNNIPTVVPGCGLITGNTPGVIVNGASGAVGSFSLWAQLYSGSFTGNVAGWYIATDS